jgi:hypothetical protein
MVRVHKAMPDSPGMERSEVDIFLSKSKTLLRLGIFFGAVGASPKARFKRLSRRSQEILLIEEANPVPTA